MSTSIALIGAGGKMGCRLTDNFRRSPHRVAYVETSAKGLENLRARGIQAAGDPASVTEADVVILAVPDVTLGEIAHDIVPRMKSGRAADDARSGGAARRPAAAARPTSAASSRIPAIRRSSTGSRPRSAFRDFYGGISAKQAIVCALMWGSEAHYVRGVEIATEMYAPVHRVHRVTLEQMAMLEPALVETLAQTCMEVVKDGHDRLVARGRAARGGPRFRPRPSAHPDRGAVRRGERHVLGRRLQDQPPRAAACSSRTAGSAIFEMTDIREQVRDITTRE